MQKNKEGITLISLVVTIIVLLIIVGVTISLVIGENSIVGKAIEASNKTDDAQLQEQINMAWSACEIAYYENSNGLSKEQFMEQKLTEYINDIDNIENIDVNNNGTQLTFKHQNIGYQYSVEDSTLKTTLKGNVQVGDYVEYPVEYQDFYSKELYSSQNGWRVIDDGCMENSSGCVKLVSTAVPATWYYSENNYNELESLNECNSLLFIINNKQKKNQSGSFFFYELADKISVLTLNEMNNAYNAIHNTNRSSDDISNLSENDDLFYLVDIENGWTPEYWLLTLNSETNKLYFMVPSKTIYEPDANQINTGEYEIRKGIRPVIWLKDDLTGIFEDGVWKIN